MSTDDFERVTLRNGHRAIRHKGHDEVMHPSVGPWAEANALYVGQSGLAELLKDPSATQLCVYDIGLGAAANAAAAVTCARQINGPRRSLKLVSFECDLAPLELSLEDDEGFPYLSPLRPALEKLMTDRHYEEPGLSWELWLGDAQEQLRHASAKADLLFHDPFSPASNPMLWTPDFFAALKAQSTDDALLLTYSAATPTRVSMLLGGFFVGYGDPVGTKKETTVAATRYARVTRPLGPEWLQRWKRSDAQHTHGPSLHDDQWKRRLENHSQFQR
jgi:tRNA U34 5-methylaminomethyl-2-thiouridine-forming methyltransferase MnmC